MIKTIFHYFSKLMSANMVVLGIASADSMSLLIPVSFFVLCPVWAFMAMNTRPKGNRYRK